MLVVPTDCCGHCDLSTVSQSSRKLAHALKQIFLSLKNSKFSSEKKFDISYFCTKLRLWVHVSTASVSTHNLCFGAKIRKIGIPLQTPVFLYKKVGFKGVYISRTCFLDTCHNLSIMYTIIWVQDNFSVSYPIRVIPR